MRLLAGTALAALLLTGCSDSSSGSRPGGTWGEYEPITVETPSGTVVCVVWDGSQAGGLDCDWGHAK